VCFHHIRRLRQIRRLLGTDLTAAVFSAFVLSRLDYCNAIYLPVCPDLPLYRYNMHRTLQHCTSVSTWPRRPNQYTPGITLASCTISDYLWGPLPILMHLIYTSQAPSYLTDTVIQTATVASRSRLRSSSNIWTAVPYEQPRARLKLGKRAFSYILRTSCIWNTLPTSLQQIPNTETFERHLKTFFVLPSFLTSISVL